MTIITGQNVTIEFGYLFLAININVVNITIINGDFNSGAPLPDGNDDDQGDDGGGDSGGGKGGSKGGSKGGH